MATLKVKCPVVEGNPHGYYVIDEENFDESKHEIYNESAPEAEGVANMTYDELKVFLTNNGVEYKSSISKKDALALALEVEATK